jgi:pyrimidine operon attenuation protein/uracil phosphoribosyltransferase
MGGGRRLLDANGTQDAIEKLGIMTTERGLDSLAIVGIRRRGVPIAARMAQAIEKAKGKRPLVGALDITLYRDDLSLVAAQPVVSGTEIDFPVEGKRIVLVDDVLFTGRTVRSAIDALIDLGRPAKIELAVLVDRGWRELPIEANYASLKVDTSLKEVIKVHVKEIDGSDYVEVVEMAGNVK